MTTGRLKGTNPIRAHGTKVPQAGCSSTFREDIMQAAVDRGMKTYGMIVNLSAEEERATREKVISYLAEKPTADEKALAIEELRYLRSVRELESRIKDERDI
jgi:hypothetical protein